MFLKVEPPEGQGATEARDELSIRTVLPIVETLKLRTFADTNRSSA